MMKVATHEEKNKYQSQSWPELERATIKLCQSQLKKRKMQTRSADLFK